MLDTDTRIRLELSRYLGSLYAQPPARPLVAVAHTAIPHAVVSTMPAPPTVCSVLAGGVVIAAYPDAAWDASSWGDLQIYDTRRPWSPIDALVRAGVGVEVAEPVAGRWHYAQGWRVTVPPTGGHAWLNFGRDLIAQASSTDGRVEWTARTREAQRARYAAGVRFVLLNA